MAFAFGGNCMPADSMAMRLARQLWAFPQEKVYVATDCNSYVSGDTIRFRAFLVDAATHRPVTGGSRFIYVELVNPFGQVDCRVKVRERDGMFAGVIPLSEELAEGSYTLGAYTMFMQNSGEESFFRKPVAIRSYLGRKYALEGEIDGRSLAVSLKERETGRPVRTENIGLIEMDGPTGQKASKRSEFKFRLGNKAVTDGVVKVVFDRYERFFSVPADTADFSVTFHPEGGYMLPERSNRVAFKALDRHGLPVEVSGVLVDDAGNEVCEFSTRHQGMGLLTLRPEPGRRYRAVADGREMPFPQARGDASVVTVRPHGVDSVDVDIAGAEASALTLLAHNCGMFTLAASADRLPLRLARADLGAGVVQLLAVDSIGRVRSSRMLYSYSGASLGREFARLPEGDYAVAVLVGERGALADTATSIVASLMLQSELRGRIENPNYYFAGVDSTVAANMDLLMMTQGWERYDVPAVLQGEVAEPEMPVEIGGVISGQARSRWRGKPLAGAKVVAIAPGLGYADAVETDSLGRFSFTGLDWPDGTVFALQVYGARGDREHNFDVDSDRFPALAPLAAALTPAGASGREPAFVPLADAIMLREIEVTAPKSIEETKIDMLRAMGIRVVTADQIKEKKYTTYDELVRRIPGLSIRNGNLVSTSSSSIYAPNPLVELWVDGVQWQMPGAGGGGMVPEMDFKKIGDVPAEPLSTGLGLNNSLSEFAAIYPLDMMETVTYYRPVDALVVSRTAAQSGGALVMRTKTGVQNGKDPSDVFVHTVRPLGYQNLAEVYEPHFVYDGIGFDDDNRVMMWYPRLTDVAGIELPRGATLVVNGLSAADGKVISVIRK